MKKNLAVKKFLILTPIIALFGAGVLGRSTKEVAPPAGACMPSGYTGAITPELTGKIGGQKVNVPTLALKNTPNQVLGVASPNEKWIEIDLSEQTLIAWEGGSKFLETLIASGLPHTPTPTGEFRVWVKLRAAKMEGGQGAYYYNLPNVPYVMYFENSEVPGWLGYGIHGTYWHNSFGTPRSHGCVNLPTPTAEKLYYWASPILPDNKTSIFSSVENPGIRVIIHD